MYTTLPKEIKFNQFLLEKVAERFGSAVIAKIVDSLDLYLELSLFVQNISMNADEVICTTSEELIAYGLNLSKQGAVHESLQDYEKAD